MNCKVMQLGNMPQIWREINSNDWSLRFSQYASLLYPCPLVVLVVVAFWIEVDPDQTIWQQILKMCQCPICIFCQITTFIKVDMAFDFEHTIL